MTIEESLKRELKYNNILEWNKNGYSGAGFTIWNTENDTEHSRIVTQRIKDSAPNCTVFVAGLSMSSNNESVKYAKCTYQNIEYTVEEFIVKFNIKILTSSVHGGSAINTPVSKFFNSLKEKYGLIFFSLAGNDGESEIGGLFPPDVAIYIGACAITDGGTIRRSRYSSVGEELDFMNFTGWQSGTSFSAPYTAGMALDILQRYKMNQDEMYKYLKMICYDLGNAGFDNYNGWGIPVLPELDRKYVTMSTNSNEYCVDGNIKTMDTKPVNLNGNVFVPVRAISESLGADVKWEPILRTVLINDIISLQIGNKEAFIGNKSVVLNYAPFIDKNNRTLVPIRFIAEALNCKVDWVQSESKVMILENPINK